MGIASVTCAAPHKFVRCFLLKQNTMDFINEICAGSRRRPIGLMYMRADRAIEICQHDIAQISSFPARTPTDPGGRATDRHIGSIGRTQRQFPLELENGLIQKSFLNGVRHLVIVIIRRCRIRCLGTPTVAVGNQCRRNFFITRRKGGLRPRHPPVHGATNMKACCCPRNVPGSSNGAQRRRRRDLV